jgi:hypothetical protein
MKIYLMLFLLAFHVSAYKRECYVNYNPETMRAPFYGRPSSYIFQVDDQSQGLFVYPDFQYFQKRKCARCTGCLRKIYRRCRKPKGIYVHIDAATQAKIDGTAVSTCFVQLSKVDTDQLYEDFNRFDPQTYLDDLEFFQNSLVGTVAEEVTLMKRSQTGDPYARAQVYDILDLLNNYTS